jgi:hypothetical protein
MLRALFYGERLERVVQFGSGAERLRTLGRLALGCPPSAGSVGLLHHSAPTSRTLSGARVEP